MLEGEEPVGVQLANQVHTAQKNVGAGAGPVRNSGTLQIVAGRTLEMGGDLRDLQEQPKWYRSTHLCQQLTPLLKSWLLKKQRKERRIKDKLLKEKKR